MTKISGLALVLTLSGCTVLIDDAVSNLPEGDTTVDAGPTGPVCEQTSDCLQISGREFDCMQVCVFAEGALQGNCLPGPTPDGIGCGPLDSDQICVDGSCGVPRCGDGYIDRFAAVPEHCDDGNTNDLDFCSNSCTRSCVGTARPNCYDDDENDDPCSGTEMCNTTSGFCEATRASDDGTACMIGEEAGTCEAGRCVL